MNEPHPSHPETAQPTENAAQRGAEDAKKFVSNVIPSLKSAARKVSYGFAYGTAYGGSFAATLIKEITPQSMKDGFSEGAGAGKAAAANLMAPKEKEETPLPENAVLTAPPAP